ncbi:MAG: glycosyltransferase [Chromatiales bacterium]|nr:glycosyltransferase [Chromatiales bacterium]
MKIVHALLSLDLDYGGPASSVQSLAAAQANLGHDVTIVVPCPGGGVGHTVEASDNPPGFERVSVRWVKTSPTSLMAALLMRQGDYSEHLAGVDIVHIHDLWQPFLLQVAYAARQLGVPYVISPHGTLNSWSLRQKALKKAVALRVVWRDVIARAAFIHALTATEAAEIARLDIGADPVIVGNGAPVTPQGERPRPGAFRQRFGLAAERPFILFLGRLHPNKGLDILISAFAVLARTDPDIDLVIAGPDEGALSAAEKQVATERITGRVRFVGPVYGVDKLAAFGDAEIFCLPSRGEAFSIAVLEAMASETTVVISEQCNFPELAAANAGVICPLDACAFADSLTALHRSPQRRMELAANARRLVEAKYTWEQIARQVVAAYALRSRKAACS